MVLVQWHYCETLWYKKASGVSLWWLDGHNISKIKNKKCVYVDLWKKKENHWSFKTYKSRKKPHWNSYIWKFKIINQKSKCDSKNIEHFVLNWVHKIRWKFIEIYIKKPINNFSFSL